MVYNNNIICIPKYDNHKRFLLGQHGTRELLAIGLNPSSANEHKLDPTSRNIKIIANNNDYDGWWLTNLYAFRTPKPNLLPLKADIKLGKENIDFIKNILNDKSFNTSTVLLCWGNNIDRHDYLRGYATELLNYLVEINMNSLCIGLTAKENPFHPSPMGVNRFLGGINNIKLQPYKKTT